MKKYFVRFTVDAMASVEVEAANQDQAEELAWSMIGRPSVCHQCSREIEIGDIMDLVECEEIS